MNKPGEFQQPVNLGSHELEQLKTAQREAVPQQGSEPEEAQPKKTSKKAK